MRQSGLLPKRPRGRLSVEAEAAYRTNVQRFCAEILEIQSRLDFKVSARGWAYILEGDGAISKDDLDAAEILINRCRKSGDLPLDVCAEDGKRQPDNLESLDDETPKQFAEGWVDYPERHLQRLYADLVLGRPEILH